MLPLLTDPKASELLNLSLRLLLNLSFDPGLRGMMLDSHLLAPVSKLASGSADSPSRQVSRCLLYQLSRDEKARNLLSYTDAFPLLVSQSLSSSAPIPLELNALLINTALSKSNALLLLRHNKGKTLRSLVKRALKTRDPLLMKSVRNLADHPGESKEALIPFIGKFAQNCTAQDQAFAVECIGHGFENEHFRINFFGLHCFQTVISTLANLNLATIDYAAVLEEYDLVRWLKSAINAESETPDDIVLEAVILGQLSRDRQNLTVPI